MRAVAQKCVELALQVGNVGRPDNADSVEAVLPGGFAQRALQRGDV
jgi:hypothetical protein